MAQTDERGRLRHLGDMEVELVVEVGRKKMKLEQARRLKPQDIVELDKKAGEPFSVQINGIPFAEGEIVVTGEIAACRLTRMVDPPVEKCEVEESGQGGGEKDRSRAKPEERTP